MLTLSVFQTVDILSVTDTLNRYVNLETDEGKHDPTLGILMDFLSPHACSSLITVIAQQVVAAYANDQAPADLVQARLEIHPLGAVLSREWRESITQCVSQLYPDLSDEAVGLIN